MRRVLVIGDFTDVHQVYRVLRERGIADYAVWLGRVAGQAEHAR